MREILSWGLMINSRLWLVYALKYEKISRLVLKTMDVGTERVLLYREKKYFSLSKKKKQEKFSMVMILNKSNLGTRRNNAFYLILSKIRISKLFSTVFCSSCISVFKCIIFWIVTSHVLLLK